MKGFRQLVPSSSGHVVAVGRLRSLLLLRPCAALSSCSCPCFAQPMSISTICVVSTWLCRSSLSSYVALTCLSALEVCGQRRVRLSWCFWLSVSPIAVPGSRSLSLRLRISKERHRFNFSLDSPSVVMYLLCTGPVSATPYALEVRLHPLLDLVASMYPSSQRRLNPRAVSARSIQAISGQ